MSTTTISDYYKLSESQRAKLEAAYARHKDSDLGLTFAAKGWHESAAGNVRINMNKPILVDGKWVSSVDLGFYHLNSYWFLIDYYKANPKVKRNHYMDNVLLDKVTDNDDFAGKYAERNFLHWRNGGASYQDSIKHYNCGGKIDRQVCINYYNTIIEKVRILQEVYE